MKVCTICGDPVPETIVKKIKEIVRAAPENQ